MTTGNSTKLEESVKDNKKFGINIEIINDVKKLTKEAFKDCINEDEGAYTGSHKAIISCICLKLQSDKWAKKTLGFWYP